MVYATFSKLYISCFLIYLLILGSLLVGRTEIKQIKRIAIITWLIWNIKNENKFNLLIYYLLIYLFLDKLSWTVSFLPIIYKDFFLLLSHSQQNFVLLDAMISNHLQGYIPNNLGIFHNALSTKVFTNITSLVDNPFTLEPLEDIWHPNNYRRLMFTYKGKD